MCVLLVVVLEPGGGACLLRLFEASVLTGARGDLCDLARGEDVAAASILPHGWRLRLLRRPCASRRATPGRAGGDLGIREGAEGAEAQPHARIAFYAHYGHIPLAHLQPAHDLALLMQGHGRNGRGLTHR